VYRGPVKRSAFLVLCCLLWVTGPAHASTASPGLYDYNGHTAYVGVEHELPDAPENEFFDPLTQRTGSIDVTATLHLRRAVHEERHIVNAAEGRLGVSLYYSDTRSRSTIILVHGSDAETREMGFIIPFFVLNGVNVLSYDQRGTGESAGNWFFNGPVQRAQDVAAIYDAFRSNPLVDSRRIGVWGFSNGGWTAPIVAVQRPIAFMILKSAPAESILSNIDYEAVQEMHRHHMNARKTQRALAAWHSLEGALNRTQSWTTVQRAYADAKSEGWFAYSLLPDLRLPPAANVQAGLRRFISYDPAQTLQHVRAPTLALYGALDRKVDVPHASVCIRKYFRKSGMRDFTMKIYPHAGHVFVVTTNGYDAAAPKRYIAGYPQVMISWLAARGFTKARSR
jgi:pimeloyl-ACP methyl ester carboxylesterase